MFTYLTMPATTAEDLGTCERYLRLALKAQPQYRATLETLANIKNPQTVLTQQANIAHGPQQVNNSALLDGRAQEPLAAGGRKAHGDSCSEAHERVDRRTTKAPS